MTKYKSIILIVLVGLFLVPDAYARLQPHLNFTDLISGPSTGLKDGFGSGAIVTIWGNNLGPKKVSSKIKFQDSTGTIREVAHTYYWKNADGKLPGGPANLFESHKMQEVAISIPDSAPGIGYLYAIVDGEASNRLTFTVRDGNILWIHPSGSNSNDCSYSNPCGFINGDIDSSRARNTNGLGNQRLQAGDIVYSRGVEEPAFSSGNVDVGMFLRALHGTISRQIAIIAYPNTRPTVRAGNKGVSPYLTEGIVLSKYKVGVGHVPDPISVPNAGIPNESDANVGSTENGRIIGNYMHEIQGMCFNGWSGAVVSGGTSGSNTKIYGNQLVDLGCDGTSHFQHTTYMSVRNASSVVQAWDMSWNYLKDNKAKSGIHMYDEQYDGDCGVLQGTIIVHANVIVNQKGDGIGITTRDKSGVKNICWQADIVITNNVLINVGLGPVAEVNNGTSADAIVIGGDLGSKNVTVSNNLIYGFSDASSRLYDSPHAIEMVFDLVNPIITIDNNIFYENGDYSYLHTSGSVATINNARNNIFFTNATNPSNAIPPSSWTNNKVLDPKVILSGPVVNYLEDSAVIDSGVSSFYDHDIYGAQTNAPDIGPAEYQVPPPEAPSVIAK